MRSYENQSIKESEKILVDLRVQLERAIDCASRSSASGGGEFVVKVCEDDGKSVPGLSQPLAGAGTRKRVRTRTKKSAPVPAFLTHDF
jgi:hypothetical protein